MPFMLSWPIGLFASLTLLALKLTDTLDSPWLAVIAPAVVGFVVSIAVAVRVVFQIRSLQRDVFGGRL